MNWTLSGEDRAEFYLINITTNAPLTQYEGLLNITNASITQLQLTGFQADYEYSITVHAVNCGSQEGNASEPLTIRPQGRYRTEPCMIGVWNACYYCREGFLSGICVLHCSWTSLSIGYVLHADGSLCSNCDIYFGLETLFAILVPHQWSQNTTDTENTNYKFYWPKHILRSGWLYITPRPIF